MIKLIRDENLTLRELIFDLETDFLIMNDSYKNFITVSRLNLNNKKLIFQNACELLSKNLCI